jgi:mandelate racemase
LILSEPCFFSEYQSSLTTLIPLSNHLWPEISAQLMCATPTAHLLEYADWWNPVLAEPLQIERGMAVIEGVSGTGVAWNERAVERFAK